MARFCNDHFVQFCSGRVHTADKETHFVLLDQTNRLLHAHNFFLIFLKSSFVSSVKVCSSYFVFVFRTFQIVQLLVLNGGRLLEHSDPLHL